jgi:transposase
MVQVNRYYRHSKVSERKFRLLLRCFALDLTASDAARLTGLSVRSTNAVYLRLGKRLLEACELDAPISGTLEIDESLFGPRGVRGKPGRGASGKTIVFGILKRGGRIYTEVVPNCTKRTLQAIIRGRVAPGSVVHTDGWRAYDGLVDVGYGKHYRVRHNEGEYALGSNHINGIESFWSYAKRRLAQFNGVPARTFVLHLKESEFRFNHRHDDLYRVLLKMLRERPL